MSKFVSVKVKKAGGGYRMQRAMVLASGKYKFVKNTTGGHSKPRKASHVAKSKSKAIAHRRSSSPSKRRRHHATTRRSRKRHGGGNMNLIKLGGATLGLAYLLGDKTPLPSATTYAAKIPGAKTFGAPAAVGIAALAVDRFVKPNPWLKLLGAAGIVLAAAKVGGQGSEFKWVGDDETTADIGDDDIADLDDVGDDDDE